MNEPRSHTESEGCWCWKAAHQKGTDTGAYGPLISHFNNAPIIGCDLEPIEFCPWCGERVRPLTDDRVAEGK